MRNLLYVSILAGILVSSSGQAAEPTASQAEQAEVDFTKVTCNELAQQSDEERAFSLIFYFGYLLGRANATIIDDTRVSEQLLRVRAYCNERPESTVIDAFVDALE